MIPGAAPDLEADPERTVTQAVFGARCWGARTALIEAVTGRALSYDALVAEVTVIAAGLAGQGLGPGTAVGLLMPDSPEFAVAAHAVLAAGAALVPLRLSAGAVQIAQALETAGARALIIGPGQAGRAATIPVERVFCHGDATGVEPLPRAQWAEAPAIPPESIALVAGALDGTGPDRSIRLTHQNLVAGLAQTAAAGVLSGSDVVLSGVSFTDVIGLNGVLGPALRLGATVVTGHGIGRHGLLRALADQRVTVAVLPPRLVEVLAYDRIVARFDLASLRSVISVGGGVLAAETARACSARLGCPVRQGYGRAAASGFTHLNLRAAEEGTLDSVGRGLPWVSWRIADPATGRPQPAYQPGELCLSGPMVAGGGWMPTRDAAFADEHGRVYIVGRLDAARGVAGEARAPEPAALLAAHPAVRDAAVVPVPDPELGLAPHAVVVLREPVHTGGLLPYVNDQVPSYQRIFAIHRVEAIPRSPSGRVLRRALLRNLCLLP